MAVQMIALKPHRYARKALQEGEEFFVGGASQARILVALGRAAPCPPLAPTPAVEEAPAPAPARRRRKSSDATAEQTESAQEATPQPEESQSAPAATEPAQESPLP